MRDVECSSVLQEAKLMSQRKTIRPVTIRRIIEICGIVEKQKVNVKTVSEILNLSISRSREILLESERMGLLTRTEKIWTANKNTENFLRYYKENQWHKIHEYFLKNYIFYKEFIQLLERHKKEEKGRSINEIVKETAESNSNLNQTAIEVLADWCQRLGVIQRHLYTGRLYLIEKEKICTEKEFLSTLIKIYREKTCSKWHRKTFLEIPLAREELCERLKIARSVFDKLMKQIYLKNIGKIELSGAPIITHSKKSPLSEKKMVYEEENALISPRFKLKKEREGLTIGRKFHYYLAIHEL